MPAGNAVLADILDRQAAASESAQMLAAIVDLGLFVPVGADGAVMFVGTDERGPTLPGYVSEECCHQRLPQAAGAVRCDALRLLDIVQHTGVGALTVFSTGGWARIPSALLARTLRERGVQTQAEQTVRLTRSTHPLAIALRDALRDRLLDFPGVQAVWIAHARWLETGMENLMLHVAAVPQERAKQLVEAILSEHVRLGDQDPPLAVRVLDPAKEATAIREIDTLGLDTVRADHAARRIEVISQEFDPPP